jgi:predicted Fe-Mo cluster-binding NifX family protein
MSRSRLQIIKLRGSYSMQMKQKPRCNDSPFCRLVQCFKALVLRLNGGRFKNISSLQIRHALCFSYHEGALAQFSMLSLWEIEMKIGVTSLGPGPSDRIDIRLGRSPYFILVDTETMDFETIPNPNRASGSGAGIQAARLMADKEVKVMLTGNCGPNAFNVFRTFGIHVILGVDGTVRDAVHQFKLHKLASSGRPNVQNYFGMSSEK